MTVEQAKDMIEFQTKMAVSSGDKIEQLEKKAEEYASEFIDELKHDIKQAYKDGYKQGQDSMMFDFTIEDRSKLLKENAELKKKIFIQDEIIIGEQQEIERLKNELKRYKDDCK